MSMISYETTTELGIGGEITLQVEVEFCPGERQTFDSPGSSDDADLCSVKVYNEHEKKWVDLGDFCKWDDFEDQLLDEFWDKLSQGDFSAEEPEDRDE